MDTEIQVFMRIRSMWSDKKFKILIAKIIIFYLKDKNMHRVNLYFAVNDKLEELGLEHVSFSFIRDHYTAVGRMNIKG